MMVSPTFLDSAVPAQWQLERRSDGAVLVRVISSGNNGQRLPDAVFAFREGDPQFALWNDRLAQQESHRR